MAQTTKATLEFAVPVVALDGYSAAGKGTARRLVAEVLGAHELDSGALYRALALACKYLGVSPEDDVAVTQVAQELQLRTSGDRVFSGDRELTQEIRSQYADETSKIVSKIMSARLAIRGVQLAMRQPPVLVADGRDMGTELFRDDNVVRFFFTAQAEVRAARRVRDYLGRGEPANYDEILAALRQRDYEDENRTASPLYQHPEATVIDTTPDSMSAEVVRDIIVDKFGIIPK